MTSPIVRLEIKHREGLRKITRVHGPVAALDHAAIRLAQMETEILGLKIKIGKEKKTTPGAVTPEAEARPGHRTPGLADPL